MFKDQIKDARIKAGFTQQRVMKALKLKSGGIQYISNAERGKSYLSPKILKNICTLYGLDYKEMAQKQIDEIAKRETVKLSKKYGV